MYKKKLINFLFFIFACFFLLCAYYAVVREYAIFQSNESDLVYVSDHAENYHYEFDYEGGVDGISFNLSNHRNLNFSYGIFSKGYHDVKRDVINKNLFTIGYLSDPRIYDGYNYDIAYFENNDGVVLKFSEFKKDELLMYPILIVLFLYFSLGLISIIFKDNPLIRFINKHVWSKLGKYSTVVFLLIFWWFGVSLYFMANSFVSYLGFITIIFTGIATVVFIYRFCKKLILSNKR